MKIPEVMLLLQPKNKTKEVSNLIKSQDTGNVFKQEVSGKIEQAPGLETYGSIMQNNKDVYKGVPVPKMQTFHN